MTRTALSLDLLSSDSLYEREVLKLGDEETEDDLNQRIIQSALNVGISNDDVAHYIVPTILPMPANTASSSICTATIHSPDSRGSVNSQSTAPTSNFSVNSVDTRPSMPSHRKSISISSLFGLQNKISSPSVGGVPMSLPETRVSSKRGKSHFLVRELELGFRPGRGLRKLSKSFRKGSAPEMESWRSLHPESKDLKPSNGGIHTRLAGRISMNDPVHPLVLEREKRPSRPPSISTEASADRIGFRSRSANMLRRRANRNSFAESLMGQRKSSWSLSLDLNSRSQTPASPLSSMNDETQDDDENTSLQAMLASSPFDDPEPLRQEMKDAMKGRPFISVQAQNRGELRRLKAFRNKQLMALATLHELERNKMTSVFEQQQELINAKYRQAMIHLNEDRSILAELDLLAALDDRLKKEQSKLRHMEAYCSPSSCRTVTAQNLQMLQRQKDIVEQLKSDKFSRDSLNHLRERQENDNARLPKQQQVELQDLQAKKDRALKVREEAEMKEVRTLNGLIRRRRDASVARGNLRLEIWRRRMELESQKDLPGQLPYLRTEEVFDSFWMVDVPLESVLDEVLPWNERPKEKGNSRFSNSMLPRFHSTF